MQRRQGSVPKEQNTPRISIEAALYHITITESGRLECTPHWLLSMEETSQLLGIRRTTLWILAKQGDFPLFHIQKRVFVRVKSLLEWIRMKEHPEAERSTTVMASQKKLRRESFQEEFSSEVTSSPLRVCLIPITIACSRKPREFLTREGGGPQASNTLSNQGQFTNLS